MLAASDQFASLLDGAAVTVEHRVTITLPAAASSYDDVTLTVTHLSVDVSMTTDVPAQTRVQAGYPSAQATFTLDGLVDQTDASKTVGWLLGPYRIDSPLYRTSLLLAPVTIDLGLYTDAGGGTPELVRKFTGYIDDYTCHADGTVDVTAIDSRNLLRSLPDTPAVVTASPYNAGLTSEFAVDWVLRRATNGAVSSWPPQRANCVLAAGMRSSVWPEVGSLFTGNAPLPAVKFVEGVNGSALSQLDTHAAGYGTAFPGVLYQLDHAVTGDSIYIEFQLTGASDPSGIIVGVCDSSTVTMSAGIYVLGSAVTVSCMNAQRPVPGLTLDDGPHWIAAQFTLPEIGGSGGRAVTLWVDGTEYDISGFTGGTSRTSSTQSGYAVVVPGTRAMSSIAAVQVTTEAAPSPRGSFTPPAATTRSLNPLQVVPAVSGDPWQVLQRIADAELAVAGFDESGTFRFRNRRAISSAPTVRTLTSATSIAALDLEVQAAGLVDHVSASATGWQFGSMSTVWSLDTVKRIPRGTTVVFAVETATLVTQVDRFASVLPNSGSPAGTTRYRASLDSAGTATHPGVTITVRQLTSTRLRVTCVNPTQRDAFLVSSAAYTDLAVGTPYLVIGAQPVTPGNTTTVDYQWPPAGAASSPFGDVAVDLSGNEWLQDDGAAALLAQDVLTDGCVWRPLFTNLGIVPDPRLQIGDRVLIQDPDVHDVSEYAAIWGWTLSMDPGGYSMTVDARAVAPPGGWVLGVPGRSELGATTYLYA